MLAENKRILDVFLKDEIPETRAPAYDNDIDIIVFVINNGKPVMVDNKFGRVLVPMKLNDENMLDELAWSLLVMAAITTKLKTSRINAQDTLAGMDLPFNCFIERDGIVLAVTDPEYLGIYCKQGKKSGLLINNRFGVVMVEE